MEMSIKITRKKGDVDIKDVKAFAKTLAKRNVTSGVHKQEGQQVNYYSGTKVIDYACYNEFGGTKEGQPPLSNPPPRPFVRVKESRDLRNNIKRETRDIMNVIIHEKYKGNKVTKVNYLLGSIGTLYVNEMLDRINNSPSLYQGNAPRTIEQKGFDHPLVDTMLLAKSLRYKVNVINGK